MSDYGFGHDLTNWTGISASLTSRQQLHQPDSKYLWDYLHITPQRRVRIVFAPGLVYEGKPDGVDVHRRGSQIEYVGVSFENQSREEAFATAREVANAGGLSAEKLEEWNVQAAKGEQPKLLLGSRGRSPVVQLEIVHSYEPARPFGIEVKVFRSPELKFSENQKGRDDQKADNQKGRDP